MDDIRDAANAASFTTTSSSFRTTKGLNYILDELRPKPPMTPAKTQKPLWMVAGKDNFPKIAIIGNAPVKGDILQIAATHGVPAKSFVVRNIERLSVVMARPQGFDTLPVSNWLGDFTQLTGVLIETFSAEIRLYQEIIIQLAAEGVIDPEVAGSRFNKVAKLASLALGSTNGPESRLAASRAIQVAKAAIQIAGADTNDGTNQDR